MNHTVKIAAVVAVLVTSFAGTASATEEGVWSATVTASDGNATFQINGFNMPGGQPPAVGHEFQATISNPNSSHILQPTVQAYWNSTLGWIMAISLTESCTNLGEWGLKSGDVSVQDLTTGGQNGHVETVIGQTFTVTYTSGC